MPTNQPLARAPHKDQAGKAVKRQAAVALGAQEALQLPAVMATPPEIRRQIGEFKRKN